MNLTSGKVRSFINQAIPYEPCRKRYSQMPLELVSYIHMRKRTQRKVVALKVLIQYRIGRMRGPAG